MGRRRRIDLVVAVAIVATGVVAWATQAPGGSWTVQGRSVPWPVVLVAWLAVFYLLATDWVWGSWRIERLRRLRRRLWKGRRPDFDRRRAARSGDRSAPVVSGDPVLVIRPPREH